MKVLIAEDDAITRKILVRSISKWGYDVEVAEDGNSAYDALSRDDHAGIAIVDWMMPGMDGTELCRKIKSDQREHPPHMIMVTSKDEKGDVIEGLMSGADDYIKKPFLYDELKARIGAAGRIVALQEALSDKVKELEEAMAQIKQLTGIIPICMHCHKIRTDEPGTEAWLRLERYIMQHSEATFSHGVCPECVEEHYPDQKDAVLKRDKSSK